MLTDYIDTPQIDIIPDYDWMKIKTQSLGSIQVEINTLVENHVWITARKVQIPVHAMTTSHINNTIKCWNGQGKSYIPPNYLGGKTKWLEIFHNELLRRT